MMQFPSPFYGYVNKPVVLSAPPHGHYNRKILKGTPSACKLSFKVIFEGNEYLSRITVSARGSKTADRIRALIDMPDSPGQTSLLTSMAGLSTSKSHTLTLGVAKPSFATSESLWNAFFVRPSRSLTEYQNHSTWSAFWLLLFDERFCAETLARPENLFEFTFLRTATTPTMWDI